MIVRAAELNFRGLPGRLSADPFVGMADLDLAMRVVTVEPGRRTPHLHPRTYEAMYVIEGRGHFWEDGTSTPVAAGDCIIVAPDTPHATLADEGVAVKLVCFFPDPDLSSNIAELDTSIEGPEEGP